jgi:ACS family glucarate transporter-like MFS transporter
MTDRARPDQEPHDPASKPESSRTRYRVLAFTVALAAITYLDRVCIAQTAQSMMSELRLSKEQMGFVFSAFTIAYAIFEMPTGAWGDRIGTRRLLTRIVVWWSSFTIATATAFDYASLLVVRFLFGMGEAGAFPNVSKTFSRWFPVTERGTAQGIFFAGAHLGGGLTPLLVTYLLMVMPWRMVFATFGMLGFVWALAWFRWFRDDPAEHPEVSQGELELIRAGRTVDTSHRLGWSGFVRIISSRNMIALCLMYFTQAYGFYFNITWLPTYLEKARGFTSTQLGLLAGLPLMLSALADLSGGMATDRAVRAFGLRIGRCGIGMISLLCAGVCLIAGAAVEDPLLSAVLIAFAGAADSFLLGAAWGVCIDIAGPHAGLVTGAMNTAGQIGAFLSPIILPYLLKDQSRPEDWALPLFIAGGLYLAGALCWLFVDPRKPLVMAMAADPQG